MEYHQTLENFSLEHAEISEKEFIARYPHPFLVVNLDGGMPMLYGRLACATTSLEEEEDGKPRGYSAPIDPKKRILVAPVIKSGRNKFPNMITVGRTNQNDIILPVRSISKFHAYFKTSSDSGELMIVDAESRFGTVLHGEEIVAEKPRALENGNTLVFGKVARSTFLTSEFFYGYMHLNLRAIEKWREGKV